MKSYYLSCNRYGNKSYITLDIRACICTTNCTVKQRKKCKEFKNTPTSVINEALTWLVDRGKHCIPNSTYNVISKAAKTGIKFKFCKTCKAKLGSELQECPLCIRKQKSKAFCTSKTSADIIQHPDVLLHTRIIAIDNDEPGERLNALLERGRLQK